LAQRARALVLAIAALLFALPSSAHAGTPVSVELVLAVDCSVSVNDYEYALQMSGIAHALRRPEVKRLIADHADGVAITVMQWAGTATVQQVVPWQLLQSEDDVVAFAAAVEKAPRAPLSYYTAPGHAILGAIRLIEQNGFEGYERKIDVSGDGRRNTGPPPSGARALANAAGITINGLAILKDDAGLAWYYEREIAGGPGSFVMSADTFEDFADAMARKLFRELSPKMSLRQQPAPAPYAGRASARSSAVSGMRHERPRGVSMYSGQGKSVGGS
jgi:hypothetical protein